VDQYIGLMVGVWGKVSFNGNGSRGNEDRLEEKVADRLSQSVAIA
jgi:hypothetical protein